MRIITGSRRGKKLKTLEGMAVRPTSDHIKESLFNILQFDIEGRTFLDLFAGSGQLALEALSRGAAKATMIDDNREAVDIIIANAKKTKLFDRSRVSASDYAAFIRAASGKETYDIIFLDPPYRSGCLPDALKRLAAGGLFAPGALIACESEVPEGNRNKRRATQEEEEAAMRQAVFGGDTELEEKFTVKRNAVYGRVRLTLLTPKEAENE